MILRNQLRIPSVGELQLNPGEFPDEVQTSVQFGPYSKDEGRNNQIMAAARALLSLKEIGYEAPADKIGNSLYDRDSMLEAATLGDEIGREVLTQIERKDAEVDFYANLLASGYIHYKKETETDSLDRNKLRFGGFYDGKYEKEFRPEPIYPDDRDLKISNSINKINFDPKVPKKYIN